MNREKSKRIMPVLSGVAVMKMLEVLRLENGGGCIRGVMSLDGVLLCCSLELPYKGNARDISSVPAGEYPAERYMSEKFGDVFILKDVPDRSAILIHAGNTVKDTQGCIIAGLSFGEMDGLPAVLSGRQGIAALRDAVGADKFRINIKEMY